MQETRNPILVREAIVVWIASLLITLAAWGLGQTIPWFHSNLGTIVALTFLFLPTWVLWRNKIDIAHYGFRLAPLSKGLLLFILVAMTTLPIFAIGFHVWNQSILQTDVTWSTEKLQQFPQQVQGQPDSFSEDSALHIWVNNDSLWALSTTKEPIEITLKTTKTEIETTVAVHSIHLDQEGRLKQQISSKNFAIENQQWTWNQSNARVCDLGCGFSIPLQEVSHFTLQTETETKLLLGQWKESSTYPLEMDRSWTWMLLMFFVQLITVAIPEEWFFRCYLQQRLEDGLGRRWNVFGSSLGWGWIISSALFALGHLILDPRVERLAVFFPGLLFGWMFARTRSIVAPALMHALANVNIQVLGYMLTT